jgi:uncharacterized membrane protein
MFRAGMVFFLGIGLLVCFSAQAGADEECAKLITTRCEVCHYKTRICESLGKKSKGSWKRTMRNMVSYGAQVNKKEQAHLVNCLKDPSEDIKALCQD